MKRAIKHFESVRRPSGNATTQEWEQLVTDLEKRVARLGNNNEELTKKNKKMAGDVERYSEAMLSVNGKFSLFIFCYFSMSTINARLLSQLPQLRGFLLLIVCANLFIERYFGSVTFYSSRVHFFRYSIF